MRKIIHVDMDCFFAAVEIRDKPHLKGFPVAVGGPPDKRGVVAACNYEARAFGVHSAMSSAQAFRLCPELQVIRPDIEKYRKVSGQVHAIFSQYTSLIEPVSLDEAYLDVSDCLSCKGSATLIAKSIRTAIFQELALTASAGIASCKFLAKIASDENKPNGLYVITPDSQDNFVSALALEKIPGVGKVTQQKLKALGWNTCADVLQQSSLNRMANLFGVFGETLWEALSWY